MNRAYLLIGGNIGDRTDYLSKARKAIEERAGRIIKSSAIYETEAWGINDQEQFLNQALEIETPLDALALLESLLSIEESLGRKRTMKYGPRIIDIDIVLFNDDIIRTPELKIPHPEMQNRRFALQCLDEIAGRKVHPVFQKTIHQLLEECKDHLQVNKIN